VKAFADFLNFLKVQKMNQYLTRAPNFSLPGIKAL
jgi:hypothetical protein